MTDGETPGSEGQAPINPEVGSENHSLEPSMAPAEQVLEPSAQARVESEITERRQTKEEFIAGLEAAQDPNTLMNAVLNAERAKVFYGTELFQRAQAEAVRLGSTEVAVMYGNRIAAEIQAKNVADMNHILSNHANSLTVASQSMAASADLIHRAANTPRY